LYRTAENIIDFFLGLAAPSFYTVPKKWATFIFTITSEKVVQISFFSVLNSERPAGKVGIKLPPPLKSAAALPCEKQVFTAQLIHFKVMKNF